MAWTALAVEENHPVLTPPINDGQDLYIVLSTSDTALRRQIFRQGLIVWFDPSGSDKKHFGLKYPVGVPPEERESRGGYRRGGYGGGATPVRFRQLRRPRRNQGSMPADPEPTDRLEVYGPQKDDAHSFVTSDGAGISVKTGTVEGYAVYELKVPLTKTADTPYAIEANQGRRSDSVSRRQRWSSRRMRDAAAWAGLAAAWAAVVGGVRRWPRWRWRGERRRW